MKKIISFLITISTSISAICQTPPSLQWQKCYGGTSNSEAAKSVSLTSDGGYIIAGNSYSTDLPGHHGGNAADYYIVKFGSAGDVQWQASFGGSSDDIANSVSTTSDGGYIVAGSSYSNDGDVTGHHGTIYSSDCWVVKLDGKGNLIWQKSLGGSNNEEGFSVITSADNEIMVAGYSSSTDGDVIGNHGGTDGWIVKLDDTGNILWQKNLGGTNGDILNCIRAIPNGGFIVCGNSYSNDGDITSHHGSTNTLDCWVAKIDISANIVWQKSLGGSGDDDAKSVDMLPNGNFVISGYSYSNDGDVSGHHGSTDTADYWALRLDSTGNILWQKSLGGTADDKSTAIVATKSNQIVLSGFSESTNGDVNGNKGFYDYWVVNLNGTTGNIIWQKNLGGPNADYAWDIKETPDLGYIVAGASRSNSGDVSGNHSGGNPDIADAWVAKLDADLSTLPLNLLNFNAELKNSNALLQWQTATEQNSKYFTIQRSTGGLHFTNCGKIKAGGTSASKLSYSYIDDVSSIVNSYPSVFYRLQAADKDDDITYSNIIKLDFNIAKTNLTIWPNPVKNQLTMLIGNFSGTAKISVYNISGHKLQEFTKSVTVGSAVNLNTTALPAGTYIVSATVNGTVMQQKFVKQ